MVIGKVDTYLGVFIRNFGNRQSWVVNVAPRLLYPRGMNLRNSSNSRLGGSQSRLGRSELFGEEKMLFPVPAFLRKLTGIAQLV
jgi:hypothetical protein